MTPEEHANEIFNAISQAGRAKYMAGQREHGGNLWEVPIPTMVNFAKEEVIDQVSYVWTLEEQLLKLRIILSKLFSDLLQSEEPPSNGQLQAIKDVCQMLDIVI